MTIRLEKMLRVMSVVMICLVVTSAAAAERMNIVLIMADDSAADNYGCYGSTFFSTPRLDALAAGGARFTQCYSAPVCTASRVKIMTGRDNIRNYVAFGTLDSSETTFGTMMKQAGYTTAVAGKWQLHGGPNGSLAPQCGFDTFCLWNYPGSSRSRFWKPSIIRDGELLSTSDQDYLKAGPHEDKNLAVSSEHAKTIKSMRRLLEQAESGATSRQR